MIARITFELSLCNFFAAEPFGMDFGGVYSFSTDN